MTEKRRCQRCTEEGRTDDAPVAGECQGKPLCYQHLRAATLAHLRGLDWTRHNEQPGTRGFWRRFIRGE